MNQTRDKGFHRVEGEIVCQSILKLLGLFLLALVILPVSVWVVWAWWTKAAWHGYSISWWVACIGAFFAVCAFFGAPLFLLSIFRRQCLIFGADCLQYAWEKGGVLKQIPYRNIARMELVREDTGKYLGIDLHDTEDEDTLNEEAAAKKKWSGWHYKLGDDSWHVSLEEIHARLKSRVQSKQSEH